MEDVGELLERIEKLEREVAEHRAARAQLSRHAAILERLRHPIETMEKLQSHLETADKLGERARSLGEAAAGAAGAARHAPAEVPPPLRAAADGRHSAPVRVGVGDSAVVAVPTGAGGDADGWWAAIRDLVSRAGGGS